MKKQTIVLSILSTMLVSVSAFAQKGNFGLNTTDPKATMHIKVSDVAPANSAQGIIIPNVTAAVASAMLNVQESTLVYVSDAATGTGIGADINGKGFYYYSTDTAKWVKVGSGAGTGTALPNGSANGQVLTWNAGSNSWVAQAPATTGTAETNTFTRSYRKDANTTVTVLDTDYFIHLTNPNGGTITLPAASSTNVGRVYCFLNDGNSSFATGAQGGAGNVQPSYGACVISTGTEWYTHTTV